MEQGNNVCRECRQRFIPSKFHPYQKYCPDCGKKRKLLLVKQWWKRNGREYIRKYMRRYRNLIIALLLLSNAYAGDFTGQVSLSGSFIKPPSYQPSLKLSNNSWLTLTKLQMRKKGWIPFVTEEEIEAKEAGSFTLEYGGQGVQVETSLLEQDSIWGWKATFGQTAEFAWGKGSYGDRLAMAGFNTEKYSLLFVKSWGQVGEESIFEQQTKATVKPVTRYQGGDIKIPFQWRQTMGDIEVAWKQRYDELEQKTAHGFAVAVSAYSPRVKINFRDIMKDFESQTRTTDIQLRVYAVKEPDIYLGAGLIDFSGSTDSRYSAIAGSVYKYKQWSISPDFQIWKRGNDIGVTWAGNLTGKVFETGLTLRRSESITGTTTSWSNDISIARKEGSLSINYSESESMATTAKNTNISLSFQPLKGVRLTAGGGISITEDPKYIREYRRGMFGISAGASSFQAVVSPTSESYQFQRKVTSNLALGATYQRFIGGDGVMGNITFSW